MRRLRHRAPDVLRVSMVAVLVLEAVCRVHLGGIRRVWVNRRARSVGQVGTPGVGRVLAVCVLRVGATTTGTRLRLVYLVTLVDTRHRDGRTARYVQLVRPTWTVTHRLSVRCVRRVTMLAQNHRFALRVLRVSTMTTMRRARRALGAMWAITLLRHR